MKAAGDKYRSSPLCRGLTLLEMLVVLVVFSIVSVGVGTGLQSALRTPEANDQALAVSAELTTEIETWRAQAFGAAPGHLRCRTASATPSSSTSADSRSLIRARRRSKIGTPITWRATPAPRWISCAFRSPSAAGR